MDHQLYQNHLSILKEELHVAMGCTEPIAVAYAGAVARKTLGFLPQHCRVRCSGNIVKNVKGVVVPNSGGMRGIAVAAVLGIVGGDPGKKLAVLQSVTSQHQLLTRKLLDDGFCTCDLIKGVDNLYIILEVEGEGQQALVEIQERHDNITRLEKNHTVLFQRQEAEAQSNEYAGSPALLTIENSLAFADEAKLEDLEAVLEPQMRYNAAISQQGLEAPWGACVGRTLLGEGETSARILARAWAAAGSDARMGGCALPVVINSGSGNQGLTISMPLLVYGDKLHTSRETLLRALALANLLAVHQKKYIGRLSAYCGATSAGCAAACGVAYLKYRDKMEQEDFYQLLCGVITNTLCTLGGMLCDGAKSSCAAKISLAVEAGLLALDMAVQGHVFQSGEGLAMENAEQTVAAIGHVAHSGMQQTDLEILQLMLSTSYNK